MEFTAKRKAREHSYDEHASKKHKWSQSRGDNQQGLDRNGLFTNNISAAKSNAKGDRHDLERSRPREGRQNGHKNSVPKTFFSYQDAVAKLPQPTSLAAKVNTARHAFTDSPPSIRDGLPSLPPICNPALASAPFIHKSSHGYSRSSAENDMSYERLEFLGDAYLELFASRMIFHRYPHLPTGTMSQIRELLVKNETLGDFSKAYGFEERIVADKKNMLADAAKRNKGFNKVLGDVFEAYIAAVILADPVNGFKDVEDWLTALWAPKIIGAMKDEMLAGPTVSSAPRNSDAFDNDSLSYNPNAKIELQKRIAGRYTRIEYEPYQNMLELKGDKLGQNRHFIAVYFTGYGYEKKCLGKGEGKNKLEAGNRAAMQAMHGEGKGIVNEAEEILKKDKDEAKKKREEEERGTEA